MDSVSLANRIAIVTGGTRGIGKGISLVLAQRGAHVAMVYSSSSKSKEAEETVREINALGTAARAVALVGNVADVAACQRIVTETQRAFGESRIDILVHNAGIGDATPTTQCTPEIFDAVMAVNVRGPLFLTQAAVPHMPRGGRIIAVSSISARMLNMAAGMPAYAASKAALEGLVRAWATEFGHSRGITANAVSPGLVETSIIDTVPPDVMANIRHASQISTAAAPRSGTPDDIGQIVAFLASEGARWVTASTVSASGGRIPI